MAHTRETELARATADHGSERRSTRSDTRTPMTPMMPPTRRR
jgi:hypothetical protein